MPASHSNALNKTSFNDKNSHTLHNLHNCAAEQLDHSEATVVGTSQYTSTTWCFSGSNNTAFLISDHAQWLFCCDHVPSVGCLLSRDSGRVTGQLKPQMYYSSTHVRYYRGTGWLREGGRGVACTAAPQGQEADANRCANEQAGR